MKAQRSSRGVVLLCPNLGARGWSAPCFGSFTSRNSPFDGRLDGPQGWSGWVLVERKSLVTAGDETLNHPAHSRLLY